MSAAIAAAACSSPVATAGCPAPDGTYALNVNPTGQSENLSGPCNSMGGPLVFDLSIENGTVSLGNETCALCAANECQVDIVCGESVRCPSVTAASQPGPSYIQTLEFVVPRAVGEATINAVVDVGPNYCSYAGSAVRDAP